MNEDIMNFESGIDVDSASDRMAEKPDEEFMRDFFGRVGIANFLVPYRDKVTVIPLLDVKDKGKMLPIFSRFSAFEKAVNADMVSRKASCQAEIDFYMERKKYCDMIVSRLADGRLPLRVTHNDTKLNNVMLDDATDKPVAVIDLDTVMKGSLLFDYGDGIRSTASDAAEDETDLNKVHLNLELFEAYTRGFLSEMAPYITEEELAAHGVNIVIYANQLTRSAFPAMQKTLC